MREKKDNLTEWVLWMGPAAGFCVIWWWIDLWLSMPTSNGQMMLTTIVGSVFFILVVAREIRDYRKKTFGGIKN